MDENYNVENIDIESQDISDEFGNSPTMNEEPKLKSAFENIIEIIFKGDKIIWLVFVILCVISMVEVFSATSTLAYKASNHWGPMLKHSLFLLGGFGLILLMHNIPYRFYSLLTVGLLISIILLILTEKLGKTVNGAERWLQISVFTVQPSEFAKLTLMGTIAFLLSRHKGEYEGMYFKWMIGLIILVTGIIAIQNLSTALLLFIVCFLMMFIGDVKISRLLKLVGAGVAFVVIAVFLLKVLPPNVVERAGIKRLPTWQSRIAKFGEKHEKDKEKTYVVTDENYQVAYAQIAIANGGVIGKFPGKSKTRDFLPQAYSDFIYAIIIEEMGIIGGVFVLLLYVMILFRAGIIARRVDNLFPKYLVLGSALMLSIQALVNMAVAVNLIPVTGQPLPLISRGGTSTLVTCAYFGLILSADRFSKERRKKSMLSGNDDDSISDNDESQDNIDILDIEKEVEYKVIQI